MLFRSKGPLHGVALFAHGEDLGRGDERLRQHEVQARAAGLLLEGINNKLGSLTISGFHNDPNKERFNERSQMRISLGTVGTPLTDFQSTRELIMAFRDAIEGMSVLVFSLHMFSSLRVIYKDIDWHMNLA